MEEVLQKADVSEGIGVNGENLTKIRFANDVVLFNEKNKTNKQTETHLNSLNSENLRVWPKKYTRERKYMTNHLPSN